MLPLVITLKQVDGGTRRYAFADSPVSIGRSPFAELQLLEPFISRWEGTLRFDTDEITYFRLGSTNATYVDGALLAQCEDDVPLNVDSVLTLGDLELRFAREHVAESDLRRKGKSKPTRDDKATGLKTQYLDASAWAKFRVAPVSAAPVSAAPVSAAPVSAASAPVALEPRPASAPAAVTVRPATVAPLVTIAVGAAPLPSSATSPAPTRLELDVSAYRAAARLASSEAAGGPRGERRADTAANPAGAPSSDLPELRAWLRALSPELAAEPSEDMSATLSKVLALLEALVQSLAEIHDAQESVRRRWLGRSARRSVLQSDDGNAVLAYLLHPKADWNERLRELEESVRGVVTHELALFRATLEGARALMDLLSPRGIAASTAAAESESPSGAPAPGFWTRLWRKDTGHIGLWRRFVAAHDELMDGARYERIFLGRVFVRSYLAAMGRPDPIRD